LTKTSLRQAADSFGRLESIEALDLDIEKHQGEFIHLKQTAAAILEKIPRQYVIQPK